MSSALLLNCILLCVFGLLLIIITSGSDGDPWDGSV